MHVSAHRYMARQSLEQLRFKNKNENTLNNQQQQIPRRMPGGISDLSMPSGTASHIVIKKRAALKSHHEILNSN